MQLSVLLLMEQPETAGLIDHTMPVPVGSASVSVTLVAVPGPALLTVIVKPIAVPALTVAASAVLVMERLGHCTVVCAVAGAGAVPFVMLTVAVLLYVAQLAAVVGLVMCTVSVPPAGKLVVPLNGQLSVLLEITHVTGPLCDAIDHEMPLPVGSGSESEKPVAAP